ncbi:MAG TPA: DUF4392 domain-containing protein [Symbiobacteriaceae bacterium]|jgi:hypothetical protein|nr:DUF4392 domain-containing protein [Symbiobacteriaceae bacterium]
MNRLEQLIVRDPGGRGVAALQVPGDLERAAGVLRAAGRVLLATGFAVGDPGVAETDGPPGALFLGRALARLGKQVAFATHRSCEPVMRAGLAALGLTAPLAVLAPGEAPDPILDAHPVDLVVAVELPGRAADGQYYNMRARPITDRTAPLDGLLLAGQRRSIPTVAVGDGGNEAGMGKVADRVRAAVRHGETIASVVPADYLVTAGTSNWGAYGLVAALDPALLPDPAEELALLTALNLAGALDGVRLQVAATVDGLEPDDYWQTLKELKRHE